MPIELKTTAADLFSEDELRIIRELFNLTGKANYPYINLDNRFRLSFIRTNGPFNNLPKKDSILGGVTPAANSTQKKNVYYYTILIPPIDYISPYYE